jgi:hypothetical protein
LEPKSRISIFRWRPYGEEADLKRIPHQVIKLRNWKFFINSFGGNPDPVEDMGPTDVMISDWIGYSSMLGFRYYISSRMAVDLKGGFMNNSYKNDKWRIQRQPVTGPTMKIDKLPIFSLKFVYGIR